VEAVIGHGDRLGEALGFVVDAARAHRIDVAPVVLALRVHEGIAVDLRGGSEEEAGPSGLGEAESAIGPEGADLEGLDGQLEVVDGRGGAREVQHVVEVALDGDEVGHVVLDEDEARILDVGDVVEGAREEIVHAHHVAAVGEEKVAEMRAEESRPARDEDTHAGGSGGQDGLPSDRVVLEAETAHALGFPQIAPVEDGGTLELGAQPARGSGI
jgi:hypothetical protein